MPLPAKGARGIMFLVCPAIQYTPDLFSFLFLSYFSNVMLIIHWCWYGLWLSECLKLIFLARIHFAHPSCYWPKQSLKFCCWWKQSEIELFFFRSLIIKMCITVNVHMYCLLGIDRVNIWNFVLRCKVFFITLIPLKFQTSWPLVAGQPALLAGRVGLRPGRGPVRWPPPPHGSSLVNLQQVHHGRRHLEHRYVQLSIVHRFVQFVPSQLNMKIHNI